MENTSSKTGVCMVNTQNLCVQGKEVSPSAFASELILLKGGTASSSSPETLRNL